MPQLIATTHSGNGEPPFFTGVETFPEWVGEPPAVVTYFWEVLTDQGWHMISDGGSGSGNQFLPWVGCMARVGANCLEWDEAGTAQVPVVYRSDVYGPISNTI